MNITDQPSSELRLTSRPEVIVEFLFDQGVFFIAVRNVGNRPAHEIKIRFDEKFFGPGEKGELSQSPLFQRLPFLGPQREIRMLLDHSSSYFHRRQPTKISANIEYSDPERHEYQTKIDHDLEIFRSLPYLRPASAIEEE